MRNLAHFLFTEEPKFFLSIMLFFLIFGTPLMVTIWEIRGVQEYGIEFATNLFLQIWFNHFWTWLVVMLTAFITLRITAFLATRVVPRS